MRKFVNFPYTLTNKSEFTVPVSLTIEIPTRKEHCRKGFEPLPDASWIKIEGEKSFKLKPKETIARDVEISIPLDTKLRGKAYQFAIHAEASGGGNIGVGLNSNFLIVIAQKETKEDTTEMRDTKKEVPFPFEVKPIDIFLGEIGTGKVYDIEKLYGKKFSLINPNVRGFTYKLTSLNRTMAKAELKKGFSDEPEPRFLSFDEDEIEVKAKSEKDIKMYLWIPDNKKYKGKNYMFIVKAEPLDSPVYMAVYTRIYVSTAE